MADERGAAAPLELVILAPLLILLVVFVLWAGRAGRAVLVADLAAGEAAVAASVCCEDGPSAAEDREEVVEQVLRARPSLDFLCIGGIRPADLHEEGSGFVDEAWLERFEDEVPGRASGVGVIGVRLECETDGAVAPLRGLFPTVSFYGQASEVIPISPRLLICVNDAAPVEEGNVLNFEVFFSAPPTQTGTIRVQGTAQPWTFGPDDYTNKSIDIQTDDDEVPTGPITRRLQLSLDPPDAAALAQDSDSTYNGERCDNHDALTHGQTTTVTGTILDNDDPPS